MLASHSNALLPNNHGYRKTYKMLEIICSIVSFIIFDMYNAPKLDVSVTTFTHKIHGDNERLCQYQQVLKPASSRSATKLYPAPLVFELLK